MIEPLGMSTSGSSMNTDMLWRISGRLTALFVHEINNDLATLREKSGFADDVLAARKISDAEKMKHMGEIIDSCESRLNRAVALVRNFSHIGKNMGSDAVVSDLRGMLTALTPFFEKIARLQLLTVRMAVRQTALVAVRPYPLLCLILALFENHCSHSMSGECLVVETKEDSMTVSLSLFVRQKRESDKESWPWQGTDLSALAGTLGISVIYSEGGDSVSLSFGRS